MISILRFGLLCDNQANHMPDGLYNIGGVRRIRSGPPRGPRPGLWLIVVRSG